MTESAPFDVPEYLKTHAVRLCQNLSRVESLLDLHTFCAGLIAQHKNLPPEFRQSPDDKLPEVDDVLRSAVVLLHASVEDFLRSIASSHLPRTSRDLLKSIPLAGVGTFRQTKYDLSDLITHRGKTTDELIDLSIDQWLQQRSFNNTGDIAAILIQIGIDPEQCNESFADLEETISRRHRIVHNADRSRDCGGAEINPIDPETVRLWRDSSLLFMKQVLHQLQFVVEGQSNDD